MRTTSKISFKTETAVSSHCRALTEQRGHFCVVGRFFVREKLVPARPDN